MTELRDARLYRLEGDPAGVARRSEPVVDRCADLAAGDRGFGSQVRAEISDRDRSSIHPYARIAFVPCVTTLTQTG